MSKDHPDLNCALIEIKRYRKHASLPQGDTFLVGSGRKQHWYCWGLLLHWLLADVLRKSSEIQFGIFSLGLLLIISKRKRSFAFPLSHLNKNVSWFFSRWHWKSCYNNLKYMPPEEQFWFSSFCFIFTSLPTVSIWLYSRPKRTQYGLVIITLKSSVMLRHS